MADRSGFQPYFEATAFQAMEYSPFAQGHFVGERNPIEIVEGKPHPVNVQLASQR
jgi:hypothetical protein